MKFNDLNLAANLWAEREALRQYLESLAGRGGRVSIGPGMNIDIRVVRRTAQAQFDLVERNLKKLGSLAE